MTPRLAIFLTSIVLIIFSMHWFFFRSIISFFNITRLLHKIPLYGAMVILTAIVISGFIAARTWDAGWVNWHYRFAGAWLGFLVHLVLASAAIWVVAMAVHLARVPVERSAIAALFLVAACIYSTYGIFNAFSPRIREIPVYLDHVPAAWENSKIVHLTDIHLGRVHGRTFAEKLVSRVNRIEPDLVVITGDIFDGMGGRWHGHLAPILDGLNAEHGVLYVCGNHEKYIGRDQTVGMLDQTSMTRIHNKMIEIDGLEIVGVSYPGIHGVEEIKGLPDGGEKTETARILLFHTPTSIISDGDADRVGRHFSTYWMPDTSFYWNKKINIDLQLSGHTHHGQIFPFNLLTRVLYKGFDYGLNQSGDFFIYTSSGAGTWGPPMRTATISEIALIRLKGKQGTNSGQN